MTGRLGQQLGNYRLTHLLGQGGFAEVYLGKHPLLETTVAIKVLHTQVTQDDVAQFQQEARLLASLRHPHIIRVLDFGLDGQTPYLVMDCAPNGTLRTRHAKGTRLPVTTVVDYVKQLTEALQYAHDRKIVHRDIKPENMLIGEKNEILLTDFGIAVISHSSRYQSTKDMAGTVAYMAPEQIQARPRPASDQYSLGIVVYEWLCGTRPFHGSYTEVAVKHSVAPPPPLREHLPTLSPDVEHVVLMALAKQPEERFASVSAFARALEQASQDMLPTDQPRPYSPSSPLYIPSPSANSNTLHSNATEIDPSRPSQPAASLVTMSSDALVSQATTQFPGQAQGESPTPTPTGPNPSEKTTAKSTVSRRALVIGIVSGAVVAAAGGSGLFLLAPKTPQNQAAKPSPTATPPTPTVPSSNAFLTYQGHVSTVTAVAWSPPDGQLIASCGFDKKVLVWNASNGRTLFTYTGHSDTVWEVTWSPDGKRIASCSDDKTVQVYDASSGSNVLTYMGHIDTAGTVDWSPDGKYIATGSHDKTVQVWNASNGGTILTYRGHALDTYKVVWSPDGKRIASGSGDQTVQVWNAMTGSNVLIYRGHSAAVIAIAWSPDGKRIASGAGETVQVWNTDDGGNVFTYKGHTSKVQWVAWSPDGQSIASGSRDKTVQVWNANTGSTNFTYRGHTENVETVAWSPDGRLIASGSLDRTVQVWRVG